MGLRRRRSGLILALALAGTACLGPDEQTLAQRDVHRDGAASFYEQGNWVAALNQAEFALRLDADQPEMRILRALCLLRIGKTSDNVALIDQSVAAFDELVARYDADEQYEAYLGAGSAHLARALAHDDELGRIGRRLAADFLSPDERRSEQQQQSHEQEQRVMHLRLAEESFRAVLAAERQNDNSYAMVDLALVLNSQGGRDVETLDLARRAIELLDESSRLAQRQLDKNIKLSAGSKIELQSQIEKNRERETLLRDLAATIHYNRADFTAFMRELQIMEQRQLIGERQYFARADVHEQLGDYASAIADLRTVLRLRSRYLDYESDELAPVVYERLAELEARRLPESARP